MSGLVRSESSRRELIRMGMSCLALDVDTGEIRWYYQHLNDHWDLDHPFERILVDTAVAPDPDAVSWINPRIEPGEVRRVLTGIPGGAVRLPFEPWSGFTGEQMAEMIVNRPSRRLSSSCL